MKNRQAAYGRNKQDSSGSPTRARRAAPAGAAPARPPAPDLRRAVESWLSDGKAQGWSVRTVDDRRNTMERFAWWLQHEAEAPQNLASLSPETLRAFLGYVREERPGGRFGSEHPAAQKKKVKPATANAYYRCLRAFVNFCLAEGLLRESPLRNVKAPKIPKDQIQPLSEEQVQDLVDAARRSRAPERDEAIAILLYDTGMRVSELCGILMGDVDREAGALRVLGKGNKERTVRFGRTARRKLWRYIEAERADALPDEPLFTSIGGHQAGAALTPNGIYRLIRKAGEAAGLKGVRISPHTLRHSFAIAFLRSGRNLLELQQILGHEDLTVLQRYVALAATDLDQAHRAGSPADRMKLK